VRYDANVSEGLIISICSWYNCLTLPHSAPLNTMHAPIWTLTASHFVMVFWVVTPCRDHTALVTTRSHNPEDHDTIFLAVYISVVDTVRPCSAFIILLTYICGRLISTQYATIFIALSAINLALLVVIPCCFLPCFLAFEIG
jgi:tryptophan-rich sensory protein